MDVLGQEIVSRMLELRRTDTPGFLGMYAILHLSKNPDGMVPPSDYSRGDFKRTIKFLRTFQHSNPEFSEIAECAIGLIRRDWLHRGVNL